MNILINKYIYVYLLFMSCFTLMIHDAHMSIPETHCLLRCFLNRLLNRTGSYVTEQECTLCSTHSLGQESVSLNDCLRGRNSYTEPKIP